jgi:hypothetical protein
MGVDILYGMPDFDAGKQQERGDLYIGGCCVGENMPDRHCFGCHHEWPIKRRHIPDDGAYETVLRACPTGRKQAIRWIEMDV